MRQKRIKGVTETLLNERGVITEIKQIELPKTSISLEIGSGKGQFITQLAMANQAVHFIALERNKYVCYRILEKKEEQHIDNLTIILGDATDLKTYLGSSLVDYIYLNFSDPWPKKRHHKRRLTATPFLRLYHDILKTDGHIQCRTDHHDFFTDTVTTFSQMFDIEEINWDLPPSLFMTEYEEKKRTIGPIYQIKGRKKHVT